MHIDGANLKARGFAGSDNKDRKYTTDFNQITGVISLYAREALKNILKVYRENEKKILSFNFGEEDREVMSDAVISELETKLESDDSNLSTSTINTEPDAYVKLVEEIDLDEAKQQVTYITPEQVDERLAELSSNPYVQEYLDLIGQKKDYEDESESLGGSLGPIL